MIRDRKMYVAPTPFALTDGTTGLATLIVPKTTIADDRFQTVGKLSRIEGETIVVGYRFDLRENTIISETIPNPYSGAVHEFTAYRLKSQSSKRVTMNIAVKPDEIEDEQ